MSEQLKNVSHEYIRYANCWEDADVLLEGLDLNPDDKVLSICSAGDNSFSLLSKSPKLVVAVDINLPQLYLTELKKWAFKLLSYEDFLRFLGFEECKDRVSYYYEIKDLMSNEAVEFWDNRLEIIESGVIFSGKFERYFNKFRKIVLPLVHSKKRIHSLFEEKSKDQQELFYRKKWNNWRWRLFFKLFFSKTIMGKFGRDPKFLSEVKVNVSQYILTKAKMHLSNVQCQKNYLLHFIMKGDFGGNLPHYARRENFEIIKNNIERLKLHHGVVEGAFKEYGNFSKFNLSNIFEYMSDDIFKEVTDKLVENGSSNAKYVHWNLMVPRKMHEINSQLKYSESLTNKLIDLDCGFFYAQVICSHKK